MVQSDDDIDFFHFSFWLLKDIFWLLKWKFMATFMVVPTVLLTLYIISKTKKIISTTTIFSSWVMMNVFWMLHELYNTPLFISFIFIFIGVSVLILYVLNNKLFKKKP
jgi:hypothetical protein